MTEEKRSIIEALYIDNGDFDVERAVRVLKNLLSIQRGNCVAFFKKDLNLKAEDKVLAYALVKKALAYEGEVPDSSVSGRELKEKTNLKGGTVDVTLKRLKEEGKMLGGRIGSISKYEIPEHEVEGVIEQLEQLLVN